MEKVRLGRTNMMVSKLGFGGIPIQRVPEDDEAVAVIRRCLDLGITYLDTANLYSNSEERIGKAIMGRREGLILATKTMARSGDVVESHLKLSLKRLGVEAIDLYQFHDVSKPADMDAILAPGGPLAVAEQAKKAGLVKHIGVTSHSVDMAIKLVKTDRFQTIMFPLNFITSEAADELLPLTREHDIGFIVMKPLAGGMLDSVSIAFKYLLQFPDVVILVGIEQIREIEEIVEIMEGPRKLTRAQRNEMERMKRALGNRFCRRCGYCLPCTEDIPIPTVMAIRNLVKRLPPARPFTGYIAEAMEKAVICSECGECETRCPYHLPIREMIKEHISWYQVEKKNYLERTASK